MNTPLEPLAAPAAPGPAATPELNTAALTAAYGARVGRAAALVRAGAVEALGNGRFRVRSAGGSWWAVRDGYCNCPDFAWRGAVPCKHLIAVELARSLLAAASDAA